MWWQTRHVVPGYNVVYRGAGSGEYWNHGNICVLPSFDGWPKATEVMENGERVEMGLECEGDEVYDMDKYWITKPGAKCKIVCRGDMGGKYLPKTIHWHKLACNTPIPVQHVNPVGCYYDKWDNFKILQECMPKWQELGLGLQTANKGYSLWDHPPS